MTRGLRLLVGLLLLHSGAAHVGHACPRGQRPSLPPSVCRQPPLCASAPTVASTVRAHSRRHALHFGGSAAVALAWLPFAARADTKPVWLSGRSDPIRPTSKDKPDGTKKDGRYLRCLNDCVPRKQGSSGSKERAECLDECQLECCETYEQVPAEHTSKLTVAWHSQTSHSQVHATCLRSAHIQSASEPPGQGHGLWATCTHTRRGGLSVLDAKLTARHRASRSSSSASDL